MTSEVEDLRKACERAYLTCADLIRALDQVIGEANAVPPNPLGWAAESLAKSVKSIAQAAIDKAKP